MSEKIFTAKEVESMMQECAFKSVAKVLDMIRAEIEENINYNKKMNYQGIVAGLQLTLDIIDKYRNEVNE